MTGRTSYWIATSREEKGATSGVGEGALTGAGEGVWTLAGEETWTKVGKGAGTGAWKGAEVGAEVESPERMGARTGAEVGAEEEAGKGDAGLLIGLLAMPQAASVMRPTDGTPASAAGGKEPGRAGRVSQ